MLTRKHFIELANLIHDNTTEFYTKTETETEPKETIINWHKVIKKDEFVDGLMKFLKKDNINFNYTKFQDACDDGIKERRVK